MVDLIPARSVFSARGNSLSQLSQFALPRELHCMVIGYIRFPERADNRLAELAFQCWYEVWSWQGFVISFGYTSQGACVCSTLTPGEGFIRLTSSSALVIPATVEKSLYCCDEVLARWRPTSSHLLYHYWSSNGDWIEFEYTSKVVFYVVVWQL